MKPLIETRDLSKHFDQLQAVEGLTFAVQPGEVLALLGPNGAGKTTTIRMLASILQPTRGEARVAGYDVVRQPREVRRSIGLLTEHHGLYTRMQAEEYLLFFGRAYGLTEAETRRRARMLMLRYGLQGEERRRLGEFSRGMRQKLALARALLHDPPVLLLDEPTSAMDPASAKVVRESIRSLRSAKRAIIVCTHNLTEAEAIADRIAIIRRGRLVAEGSPNALKRAMLGEPIMELRLACPLNGVLQHMPPGIELVETGNDWLRYRTDAPEEDNPRVLAAMARARLPVVTLSEVDRTLEEVYLQVVEGDEGAVDA